MYGGHCSGENKEVKTCGTRMRVRKEVRTLTATEAQKIRYAMEQAMTQPTNGVRFRDIANYHGAPYTICAPPEGCCPHGGTGHKFATWHRLYNGKSMISYEEIDSRQKQIVSLVVKSESKNETCSKIVH